MPSCPCRRIFPTRRERHAGCCLRRVRILIAEDDAELRTLLASLLRRDGHEVVTAEHGSEVIPLVTDAINLIVLDVRMPGQSGIELLQSIRTAGFRAPIVLM